MDEIKINFLQQIKDEGRKHLQKIPRFLFYPIIFAVIFLGIFAFQVILSEESFSDTVHSFSFFGSFGLRPGTDRLLKGEADDRINILLTGMGGIGHDGPFLTDTMILASIRPSDHKLTLLSLPRDLSLPLPNEGWRKINNINSMGEVAKPGSGAEYTAQVLGDLLAQPIQYYVRADFSGFQQLVDELGGIKIYVDTAFTDHEFPDDNYGFKTVSFSKGWQKMDGATALEYVRSRHGSNGEASDFARSQRQQKVLKAVKDNALSIETFLNPLKIAHILDIYQKNITTNLQPWEIYRLAKMESQFSNADISVMTFDDSPSSPIYSKIVNGAYLLIPKDQSLGQLHDIVAHIFDGQAELKKREQVIVDVRNGTFIEGLASRVSDKLSITGYTVAHVGNAPKKDYQKTVIYDLTNGQKPNALEDLKTKLNANVTSTLPEWLLSPDERGNTTQPTDFIIILGTDQKA